MSICNLMIQANLFNYSRKTLPVIFVVNIRGALDENSRESMRAAALRWDVSMVECTDHESPLHPACWKTMAFSTMEKIHGSAPRRILILDADMVVSSECPNPFEVFTEQTFAVVTDRQTHNPARDKAETDEWEIVTGKREKIPFYFNSGFILASYRHHVPIFNEAATLCEEHPHLCWHDQTPFNVSLHLAPVPIAVCQADMCFNFQNPCGRIRDWQDMRKSGQYIYHFPGNPDRNHQIKQVTWR